LKAAGPNTNPIALERDPSPIEIYEAIVDKHSIFEEGIVDSGEAEFDNQVLHR